MMNAEPTSILIVEDERVVARDIQNRLARFGYSIAGVTRLGEEAVRIAEEKSPSLVLMDIRLRGAMDGITAAQIIRDRAHVQQPRPARRDYHRVHHQLPDALLRQPPRHTLHDGP